MVENTISIEIVELIKSIRPGESVEIPNTVIFSSLSRLCKAFKGLECTDNSDYYTVSRRASIKRDSIWMAVKPILGKFLREPLDEVRVFESMHRVRKCVIRFNRENGTNLRVRVVYGKHTECIVYCQKWEKTVMYRSELNGLITELESRKILDDEII
jgi:hypothetical protein